MLNQVPALDVADEIQAAIVVEHLRGQLNCQVALAPLLADRQQSDTRFLDAQDALGVDGAHVRELVQVVAARIHVRADI